MTTLQQVCETIIHSANGALIEAGAAPVTRLQLTVGFIAWDDCCGQLTVAPEGVFQYEQFPDPVAEPTCVAMLGVNLLLQLMRCVDTVTETGDPPAESDTDSAYSRLLSDASTLLANITGRAHWCEWWDVANISQTFVGDQGGCIGVDTRFTVGTGLTEWA